MSTSTDTRIGTRLAGYRIEALLGRGGMSVVYLAHDLALDRKVALKLLAPELAEDERFRERFLRESRVAASLDHANVIPIHEAGEAEGLLYIVMRYVEGTDLGRVLEEEGPLAPERTISLLGQAAGALDAARFTRDLVHRDVKPGNILIATEPGPDHDGGEIEHVYLSDFGLSKYTTEESLTEGGQFIGTIDYVAPEQIEGDSVDGRADVYSLGCVLYECLTGDVPYRRDSKMAVFWAHLADQPPTVAEADPDLPQGLNGVVAKALAKNPDDRYPTCRELVAGARAELRPTGEHPQLHADPGASGPTWSWRRVGLLAALVSLIVTAAVVPAVLLTRDSAEATGPAASGDQGPPDSHTNPFVRIDPATNDVALRELPGGYASDWAIENESLWVMGYADQGSALSRFDPDSGSLEATVERPETISDIAVAGGVLWAIGTLEGEGRVIKLDSETGTFLNSATLGRPDLEGVVADAESVWLFAHALGNAVLRLDPASMAVVETIRLEKRPIDIAIGEDAVWVIGRTSHVWIEGMGYVPLGNVLDDGAIDRSKTLIRIDPETNKVIMNESLPGASHFAVGEGAVWVVGLPGGFVSRFDPETSRVSETIRVANSPSRVGVGAGSVWVIGHDTTVSRIDPSTNQFVATIDVGVHPYLMAVGEDAVWLAAFREE